MCKEWLLPVTPIPLMHHEVPMVITRFQDSDELFAFDSNDHDCLYTLNNTRAITAKFENEILYILDTDFNLRRLRYGACTTLYFPDLVWSDCTPLLHINEIKNVMQRKNPYVEMSDTCLAFDEKIISFKTGKILYEKPNSAMTMSSSLIVSKKDFIDPKDSGRRGEAITV